MLNAAMLISYQFNRAFVRLFTCAFHPCSIHFSQVNGGVPGKFVIARAFYETGPVVPDRSLPWDPTGDTFHLAGLQASFLTSCTFWDDFVSALSISLLVLLPMRDYH
jgi:hypothetical protein